LKPTIYFIATFDTKGEDALFIKKEIQTLGAECITIDVGVGAKPLEKPDISVSDLCRGTKYEGKSLSDFSRGEAVKIISEILENYIRISFFEKKLHAVVGLGGAGGTQIITQAMRSLPYGVPKLMLSTLASGNTRWYVQDSDISMMPSVTDISGVNSFSKMTYQRLAYLSVSGARWYADSFRILEEGFNTKQPRKIGLTMYGTTTKCVENAKQHLIDSNYEPMIFHASGAGGSAMEKMINAQIITACLDMTIAEIGAHLVGGLHDAGPNRLEAAIQMKIPLVLVPGAADTIVLPPLDDIPEKFKEGRVLNFHNPTMTTMRTNKEENVQIGKFICEKLKQAGPQVKILIPKGGLSSIDKPGEIFYNPEVNEELFRTLREGLKDTPVEIIEDARHMYDSGFGELAADLLMDLINKY
jgi:uncharacterized protein (UPF0261 family)